MESNKLIAEFYCKESRELTSTIFKGQKEYLYDGWFWKEHELLFHHSWDWLMDVVEKIHLLREVKQVSISPGKTRIWFADHIGDTYIESPVKPENDSIKECYIAVVKFINWYNQRAGVVLNTNTLTDHDQESKTSTRENDF